MDMIYDSDRPFPMGNGRPLYDEQSYPITIHSYASVYEDGKLAYRLIYVDYCGAGVPYMPVRGGKFCETSPIKNPQELYSGRYDVITRAKYFFPSSEFRDADKNVCGFVRKVKISAMKHRVTPLNVTHRGYGAYPYRQQCSVSFWQMSVDFKGDIRDLFADGCIENSILMPRKASLLEEPVYNKEKNTTSVMYGFQEIAFGNAEVLAHRYERRLKSFMRDNKQDVVSPIFVCEEPILKDEDYEYEVLVKYDGNWELYFPKISNRFEYNPFGARVINWGYNATENTSNVWYRFRRGMLNHGAKRAWGFVADVKSRIATTAQGENIK